MHSIGKLKNINSKAMRISSGSLFSVKIILMLLLAIVGALLVVNGLYFSAVLVLFVFLGFPISIYRDRKKLIARMERMVAGVKHNDFSMHFRTDRHADELADLSKEMNEALELFRERTRVAMIDETENEAWQKLIRILTHEIMNSMAPIISLSETLSDESLPYDSAQERYELMQQGMATIHRRSSGLVTFVENYRKLSQLPAVQKTEINVGGMMQKLHALMCAEGIHFEYSLYPDNFYLNADENLVEQVLINLLKNAADAVSEVENPEIQIRIKKQGDEVIFHINDNGHGMDEEVLSKVFIPFYTTKTTGSGIGLTLCRQIILRHKGKIELKSADSGTQVTLTFPDN